MRTVRRLAPWAAAITAVIVFALASGANAIALASGANAVALSAGAIGTPPTDPAASPPWIWIGIGIAAAWLLAQSTLDRSRLELPVSLFCYAAALTATWSVLRRPTLEPLHAEFNAQRGDLMFVPEVLIVGLALAVAHYLGGVLRDRFRSVDTALLLDVGAVAVWSYFVRLVLTTPNILTDGGSGYRRLQEYLPGMGGLSLVLDLLRGGPVAAGDMWAAMTLPTLIAASGPVAVTLLGRALGLERRAALLAGLMLASLPIHAAMYTSDFLTGSTVALSTLGLAALVHAVAHERWEWLWPASALLAFAILIRPEALLIGVAVVAFGLPAARKWSLPIVAIPACYLACVAAVEIGLLLRTAGPPQTSMAPMPPEIPYVAWLTDQRMLPAWLSLAFPLGVWATWCTGRLRRATLFAFAVSALTAALPAIRFAGDRDPAGAPMEWPRYGTWFMPWAVLIAAAGLVWLCDRLRDRSGGAPAVGKAAYAAIALAVVATPVLAHDYLATEYGYRRDEPIFRRAVREVPAHCILVVPDDESENQAGGSIEIAERYRAIAREASVRWPPRLVVMGVTDARNHLETGTLPPAECWYMYEGPFCHIGLRGVGSTVCRDFLSRVESEIVFTEYIDYRDHRLIVRPDLTASGLIVPDMALTLHRFHPGR